ncbi:uncharacterized protein LOC108033700 [Drosophila biarmipes]|uniref:uncharacterized protein LOC108033700 n=1 Tax=Drosophila biarmipes TaxID=125945 RepID=UPI0007E68B84|nr:uncharacterized protein LOC108033700 [Drosophila biarmipes]
MSCLTSVLQLLQVLTTLSGCNIYRYVEGRRVFMVNQKIDFLVTAMHRFWLRPWLLLIFLMHIIYWGVEFLHGLTDPTPGSERPLHLIYRMGLTVATNQNIFISMGLAYHYRYHRNLMPKVLNGLVGIYHSYERICGRAPRINWWLFGIEAYRSVVASLAALNATSSVLVPGLGPNLDMFLTASGVLFVCIQPLFLSLAAYLGILIIHACYDIQKRSQRRKAFQLYDFYRKLIKLRLNFDLLARSFVWTALLESLLLFISSFHLILYDEQSVHHLVKSLLTIFIFPTALLHINVGISSTEQKFGKFEANFRPQRRTQLLWHFRHIMKATVDKGDFNVFQLDRGLILEIVRLGWVFSMFTNSLMLNSTARIKHFEAVNYKKLL